MNTNYEIFANNGISNIFDGMLIPQTDKARDEKSQKRVIGYRFESAKTENIKIHCRQPEDENGVYVATIFFDNFRRKSKKSAFFPKHWTRDDVIKAIGEAYESKVLRNSQHNQFVGKTRYGMQIILWLDDDEKIIDAMPFRDVIKALKNHRKLKRACKECGQSKHYICLEHHPQKKSSISKILGKIRRYSRKFYFGVARKLGFVE